MSTLLFSQLNTQLTLHPIILIGLSIVVLCYVGIMSAILSYHWRLYAVDKVETLKIRMYYFTGLGILGGIFILSTILYAVIPIS